MVNYKAGRELLSSICQDYTINGPISFWGEGWGGEINPLKVIQLKNYSKKRKLLNTRLGTYLLNLMKDSKYIFDYYLFLKNVY